MNFKLRIISPAEKDITETVFWYEKKLNGLGHRFLTSLDATFQSIQRNPKIYPKVYNEFRRALLPRFPYGIYYIIENNSIIVFAVLHERRNPDFWKSKIT
jgi:plasmid stabilization system protein ParE